MKNHTPFTVRSSREYSKLESELAVLDSTNPENEGREELNSKIADFAAFYDGKYRCDISYQIIDEYLTSLPSPLQSAEPGKIVEDNNSSFVAFLTNKAIYTWSEIELIEKLYREYASQLSSQGEITDEEIEKAAKEFQNDTSTSFNQGMYSGFIFGALAMRNGKIKVK